MTTIRKIAIEAALVLLTAVAGGLLAGSAARYFQLKGAHAEVEAYAHRLLKAGESLAAETDKAVGKVLADKLPFCSDQELNVMREFIFSSSQVKEMGRTRGGELYCTTNGGRLARPVKEFPPDVVIDGSKIIVRAPLLIAPRARAMIVEADGVSVVLNPEFYDMFDQAPLYFSGLLYDQHAHHVIQAFGHAMPLTDAEVIAQQPIERDGVLYQPLCSKESVVCVIGAAPGAAILARDEGHFVAFVAGGGLLGGCFGLILVLFYHRQRSFERRLRRAVRKGELYLAYQPIFDLATKTLVGAEALVRWLNEDDRFVPPDVFITVAEEKGFVGEITQFVLKRAVVELRDLLREGNFRMTVNITSEDLKNPGFFACLERCIQSAGILPASIGFELTERSTVNHAEVRDAIARLKSAGHTVYIDDFGTGYSSLAYLHDLAADAIKIDRAFTRTVGTGAITASVVPQILDIAGQLNLMVVVEGIESEQQAAYFRAVDRGILGQGFLFSRALPAAQFKKEYGALARTSVPEPLVK